MAMLTFNTRILAGAAVLAAALAACARPAPPATTAPVTAAPAAALPSAQRSPLPPPVAAVPAPHAEPALASMSLAEATSKMGVPVDLHYQFEGDASGQQVTLHLAAVPRVAGSNLNVSIKKVPGLQTTAPALNAQKVSATTAYRQQVSLTRLVDAPAEVRILVTMDLPEGTTFGWFGVPLKAAPGPAGKQPAPVQ
ncbi:MAG: hypothetical protein ABIP38_01975 [Steroidobacteraceae bacterium]